MLFEGSADDLFLIWTWNYRRSMEDLWIVYGWLMSDVCKHLLQDLCTNWKVALRRLLCLKVAQRPRAAAAMAATVSQDKPVGRLQMCDLLPLWGEGVLSNVLKFTIVHKCILRGTAKKRITSSMETFRKKFMNHESSLCYGVWSSNGRKHCLNHPYQTVDGHCLTRTNNQMLFLLSLHVQ